MYLRLTPSEWDSMAAKHLTDPKIAEAIQQDGRLPPAYFAPSHFCKEGFQEDGNISFRKRTFFLTFPTFKFFLSFAEKPIITMEKTFFYKIIPFDTHSTASLQPLGISKKFQKKFFEKTHLFFQKPKF